MSRAYFNEEQKFRQPWMMAIIFSPIAIWIFTLAFAFSNDKDMDNESRVTLIISSIVIAGITFLLLKVKLVTRIREDGIHYRFFPFHLKEKTIPKEDIKAYEIRKYRPIAEYGGWGLRAGLRGHGRAINVSGNMGLQLYLKNGKKLLFGTQKPAEIGKAMEAMMKMVKIDIAALELAADSSN